MENTLDQSSDVGLHEAFFPHKLIYIKYYILIILKSIIRWNNIIAVS